MSKKLHTWAMAYWPIVVFGLMAAGAWGTSTAQIAAVGSTAARVENKVDLVIPQIAATQATEQANSSSIADLRQRLLQIEARR